MSCSDLKGMIGYQESSPNNDYQVVCPIVLRFGWCCGIVEVQHSKFWAWVNVQGTSDLQELPGLLEYL